MKRPKQHSAGKDVFSHHQLKIARQTLRLTDLGAEILGGMTKEEARLILRKHGGKDGE
jgi:hypothetical protein